MFEDDDDEREFYSAPITLADVGVFLVTPLAGLAQGWAYAFKFAQLALGGHSRWRYERSKFKREAGDWIEALPTTGGE